MLLTLQLCFMLPFLILFKISVMKYIVSNGVGKMNVVFLFNLSFLKPTTGSVGTRT